MVTVQSDAFNPLALIFGLQLNLPSFLRCL